MTTITDLLTWPHQKAHDDQIVLSQYEGRDCIKCSATWDDCKYTRYGGYSRAEIRSPLNSTDSPMGMEETGKLSAVLCSPREGIVQHTTLMNWHGFNVMDGKHPDFISTPLSIRAFANHIDCILLLPEWTPLFKKQIIPDVELTLSWEIKWSDTDGHIIIAIGDTELVDYSGPNCTIRPPNNFRFGVHRHSWKEGYDHMDKQETEVILITDHERQIK